MATAKSDVLVHIRSKDDASQTFKKFGNNASSSMASFGNAAKAAAAALVALVGVNAVKNVVKFGVETAGQLETAKQGFKTLLESADDADRVMTRIKEEAKRTPFELPGLTKATQLLTAVTKDGDEAIEILLDVGEGLAAMGKGQAELDRIIVNLQQIGAVGHASMLDVKQFAFAGIPIFEMLQEATGATGEALSDMISGGEITFELLTSMFKEASEEGGRFFGAFENQSGTYQQSLSNMKDAWAIFLSDVVVGTGIFDKVKEVLQRVTQAFENWQGGMNKMQPVIDWFKGIWEGIVEFFQGEGKPVIDLITSSLLLLKDVVMNDLIPVLKEVWVRHGPEITLILKAIAAIAGSTLVLAFITLVGALTAFIKGAAVVIEVVSRIINWFENLVDVVGRVQGYIDNLKNSFFNLSSSISGALDKLRGVGSVAGAAASAAGRAAGALSGAAGGGRFQTGGVVPGRPGEPVPIIAHGGEIVTNPAQGQTTNNNMDINVTLDSQAAVHMFFEELNQREVAANFGVEGG